MSSASMSFGRPTRLTLPRRPGLLAGLAQRLIFSLRRLDRWQLSRKASHARTEQEVLDWASRIESVSPGMAADLRGAVLRAQQADAH